MTHRITAAARGASAAAHAVAALRHRRSGSSGVGSGGLGVEGRPLCFRRGGSGVTTQRTGARGDAANAAADANARDVGVRLAGAEGAALREHYAAEGWVVVRSVVSSSLVTELQRATDGLEAEAAGIESSVRDRGVFFEVQSASGRKGEPAVAPGVLRKVTSPAKRCKAFRRLTSHAEVLSVARDVCGVIGPECVVDQVNLKAPLVGTPFPWHQDASFLKPLARERFEQWGGVNAVIALDASDSGNGGFTVLGRTHTAGESKQLRDAYDTSGVSDALGLFDESRLTCQALQPGDAVFFHPMLAHGSGANNSNRRRRIATLWFVGSDVNEGSRQSYDGLRRV